MYIHGNMTRWIEVGCRMRNGDFCGKEDRLLDKSRGVVVSLRIGRGVVCVGTFLVNKMFKN